MNHARLAPLVALLGFATLSACDPELDDEMDVALDDALELDDVPFDLPAELEPIDSQLDELQAEADDQQTVNGCLSAPQTYFVANKNEMAWATFQVNAPYSNDYDFEVTPVAFYDQLSSWMIRRKPYNLIVAEDDHPGWNSVSAGYGDTFELEMLATYSTPQPGRVYRNQIVLQGNGQYCTQLIELRIPDCRTVGWWSTNPWPTPFYDSVNCYVATPPANQQPFIYNNSWYLTPQNGNQCAMGTFDGANCYVGSPPGGHTAFIWSGNFYFTP
ncbi:MAG TPA: hypothetical protein VK034_03590 [Enhygromyxa sp.]|nr:hypothetical protein [Enhygromyxa sp.]